MYVIYRKVWIDKEISTFITYIRGENWLEMFDHAVTSNWMVPGTVND